MPHATLRTISPTEVQKHNTKKSCYITLHNKKVYDVTAFLSDHPGGEDLILDYAGKDATEIMADEVSHCHSESAYDILDDDYLVGYLTTVANGVANGKMNGNGKAVSGPANGNANGNGYAKTNGIANGNSNGSIPTKTGLTKEEDLSVPTDITSDYKTHKFIDLNRPMFPQVWNNNWSKDFYLEQVHRPRHFRGGESAPLFGNFLEPLSKTPWYVVPMVWMPWVVYGTYQASLGLPSNLVPALFFLGICIWSLVEYVLHRCLFHVDEYEVQISARLTSHTNCLLGICQIMGTL